MYKEISISEVKGEFEKLNNQIKQLMQKLGYDGENIVYDRNDIDEEFFRSQYIILLHKLEEVQRRIQYLSKPIVEQGFIQHNSSGRYELPSGRYFTSGSVCEILQESDGEQYWLYTTIEHNGEDYYATALGRNVSINGKLVRVRI
jgi:hypothetical protein